MGAIHFKFHRIFLIPLGLMLFFFFIPDHGFAISIPEEKKVAKDFMEMIENQQALLNDPVANHMVKTAGRHILSFLPPQPFEYSFNIVNDDVFNAFAGPGSNIFLYRGLITSLDSIDEMAGILSHEIAHAASRHVSESIDRSKLVSLGTLAGILAGAIIGSVGDGDGGVAIIQSSLAIGTASMLSFTRANETEADEKGIMFLKMSCFSAEGLLSGLMKIRAADYRGVEAIPDYVKTHPGTGSRIAHTESILSGYTPPDKKKSCGQRFSFDMVKYRLIGLYNDIEPAMIQLNAKLAKTPDDPALHYGLGLLHGRKSRWEDAVSHLKKALSINMFDPMILLDLGRTYLLKGDSEKALGVLKGLESDSVLGLTARLHIAEAYLKLGDLSKALEGFNTIIDRSPSLYPRAYYNLANIMSLEKKEGLSHYYLGIYYAEIKNTKNSIVHLKKALEELINPAKIEKAKVLLENQKKELAENESNAG